MKNGDEMRKVFLILLLLPLPLMAAQPVLTLVNPDSGPEAGGTLVELTGSGLTGATLLRFGGVLYAAGEFSVVSDSSITVTTKPGTGTVPISVFTGEGSFVGLSFSFIADTPTQTPTVTPSFTVTQTFTATETGTHTATGTITETHTFTLTETGTPTATYSVTESATLTGTGTATQTPTNTMTLTATATRTMTGTGTATRTITMTFTASPTYSATSTATATRTAVIAPTIGDDLYEKLKGVFYPNPAVAGTDIFMVYDAEAKISAVFYSVDGRKAMETGPHAVSGRGKLSVSTQGLAPGVYFYRVTYRQEGGEETVKTGKLVIRK